MSIQALDKLIWTLIYGGLLAVGLGIAVGRQQAEVGWPIVAGGTIAAAAGAALVYLRSRIKDKA